MLWQVVLNGVKVFYLYTIDKIIATLYSKLVAVYTDLSLLDILHQAHVQMELASFWPNTISVNCNHKIEYIYAAFV